MLSTIRKKLVIFTIIPLVICFYSLPLIATHKLPSIFIYQHGGYFFNAFYALHTPSEPSDLLVEMIAEYNMKRSICSGNMWLPLVHFLELRFVLNGAPKKVKIWGQNNKKYRITGLDTITSSIWYHAVKKIAENLGTQFFGLNRQIKLSPKKHDRSAFTSVQINPLKNHKLHTTYDLGSRSRSPPQKTVTVHVNVQVETYQGKKIIVAAATFCDKGVALVKEDYSSIKFVHTKSGLKEISKERVTPTSVWYSWVKKVVKKSVNRYLRFKRRHSRVIRTAPIKKVKTHTIENVPKLQLELPQQQGDLYPNNLKNWNFG